MTPDDIRSAFGDAFAIDPFETFLAVRPNYKTFPDLVCLPAFVAVVENLRVSLIAFNGREVADENLEGDLSASSILGALRDRHVRLCPGVDESVAQRALEDSGKVLTERLGDRIIVRSRGCNYALFDSEVERCHECQELLVDPDLSLKQEHFDETVDEEDIEDSGDRSEDEKEVLYPKLEQSEDEDWQPSYSLRKATEVTEQLKPVKKKATAPSAPKRDPCSICRKNHPRFCDAMRQHGLSCADEKITKGANGERLMWVSVVSCPVCLKEYKLRNASEHLKYHLAKIDLEEPATCPVCQEELGCKARLNPHYHEVHDRERTRGICVVCREICPRDSLRKHVKK